MNLSIDQSFNSIYLSIYLYFFVYLSSCKIENKIILQDFLYFWT